MLPKLPYWPVLYANVSIEILSCHCYIRRWQAVVKSLQLAEDNRKNCQAAKIGRKYEIGAWDSSSKVTISQQSWLAISLRNSKLLRAWPDL